MRVRLSFQDTFFTLKKYLPLLFWLSIWELGARLLHKPIILPAPSSIFIRISELFVSTAFWQSLGSSIQVILLSFSITLLLALLLAALAARFEFLHSILALPLQLFKSSPVASLIVIFLLIAGPRDTAGLVVFVVLLPQLYFPCRQAFIGVHKDVMEVLSSYGLSKMRIFLADKLPSSIEWIQTNLELAAGMAFKAAVAAELIATPAHSIGDELFQAKLSLETVDVFAWTAIIIVISVAFERVVALLLRLIKTTSLKLCLIGLPKIETSTQDTFHVSAFEAGYIAQGKKTTVAKLPETELYPGQLLLLDAPSGSGKTTVLKTLLGYILPLSGSPTKLTTAPMLQDSVLISHLSVYENILLCAHCKTEDINTLLDFLLPGIDNEKLARQLSGGEKRRLELVRALCAKAPIILLDEPTNSLDAHSRKLVSAALVHELKERALVVSTHDSELARDLKAAAKSTMGAEFLPQTVENMR